jgi:DNA polymerase I
MSLLPVMSANPVSAASAPGCLLIVDGHAYAYRAFHAIPRLNAPDGAPTNAIFGFTKALGRLREIVQPAYVVVVWDGGLDPQRLAALPEYKSGRPPMPEALRAQLDGINAWLEASGLAWLCREGVEADDWIAALSQRAAGEGINVVIASSDKDFMQLVSPRVGLLNPGDKSPSIWAEAQVREKTGVAPGQIVDWLSLVGDAVDDIAGVPGVGRKTAADLLQQFGSVDALYQRLAEVKSDRLRAALQAAQAVVRRNQKLIRLREDLPQEMELDQLRPGSGDPARVQELSARWGFKTRPTRPAESESRQGELL